MITDIEIKNFRCFNYTKITGLGQVTLIVIPLSLL